MNRRIKYIFLFFIPQWGNSSDLMQLWNLQLEMLLPEQKYKGLQMTGGGQVWAEKSGTYAHRSNHPRVAFHQLLCYYGELPFNASSPGLASLKCCFSGGVNVWCPDKFISGAAEYRNAFEFSESVLQEELKHTASAMSSETGRCVSSFCHPRVRRRICLCSHQSSSGN